MKAQLVSATSEDLASYNALILKYGGLSSCMDLLRQWKSKKKIDDGQRRAVKEKEIIPSATVAARQKDMMEWEPTPVTTISSRPGECPNIHGCPSKRPEDCLLLSKQAKWVDAEEIEARRHEGRCLCCGKDRCHISRCPLAAVISPQSRNGSAKAKKRPAVTAANIEEEDDLANELEKE